ncbi:MAG: C40 family peptidase [Lachnospiraceae bacterium]|nr:C40 family peptidase [Lachnospiraceae bacterium]
MYFRYKAAGVVLGLALAASLGLQADAAGLGSSLGGKLSAGIANAMTQESVSVEDAKKAAAETLWVGTPLEGYTNIGICQVDDNLNVRDEASTSGKLVGKMRNESACNVEFIEGEWAYITSGEVEGYVKAEYLLMGQEAVDKALDLGQTVARAKTGGLNVRTEPSTDSERMTQIGQGEELVVLEELGDWVKVEIDGMEGYVAAEYVEVTNKMKTALTITEALYGEGVTDVRVAICEFAKQYVGNRYVWGGTSLTKGADCSGFVLAVYKNFGISLPHSSRAQANCGTRISTSQLQPGDLIFYGSGKYINHVAMYIGNGQVVHASNERTGIKISNAFYRTPICAVTLLND